MSMISSLIDELRELALWLDDEFYDAEATKVRDAADTIWQLRDDLQRANAENAKLRDECNRMYIANVKKNGEILRLMEESAKLRELVRDMYFCNDETCTDCEYHDYSGEGFWCKRGVGWKKVRMRELGVVE